MLDQLLAGLPPIVRVFLSQMLPAQAREEIDQALTEILSDVANGRESALMARARALLDYAKIDYGQYRDQ